VSTGETSGIREGKSYPMPVISMFYGVIVLMYYFDNKQHRQPHIHVHYSDEEAVIEELMANWRLAVNGQAVFKIDPLK
jgi:hypothetical protein